MKLTDLKDLRVIKKRPSGHQEKAQDGSLSLHFVLCPFCSTYLSRDGEQNASFSVF